MGKGLNKKMLFIAPKFFGYERDLINEIKSFGIDVVFLQENIDSTNLTFKLFNKLPRTVRQRMIDLYFIYKIDAISKKYNYFDYVFGIRLDQFDEAIMLHLKSKYPDAKYVCYFWDSVKNMRNTELIVKYFEKIYTFDRVDSEQHANWNFRPLFYNKQYENCKFSTNKDIDILFVGTIMPKRAKLYNEITKECRGLKVFAYFYTKLYVYFVNREKYDNIPFSVIHFKSLNQEDMLNLFLRSKVILDCSNPMQTGLTMRTIECIGAQKPLITTNKEVKKYDFYNPNNILILDENTNYKEIEDFVSKSEYQEIDQKTYKKYSINYWIKEVLSLNY